MKTIGIGEVAKILGVKPYIIRYWESELPLLAPRKSPSGRRQYSSREVELLMRFKSLLYGRKFTIEGAKKKLWEELGGDVPDVRLKISEIRGQMIDLLVRLQGRKGNELTEREGIEKFTALGQGRLFAHWEARPQEMKRRLLEDLDSLDTGILESLRSRIAREPPPTGRIRQASFITMEESRNDPAARRIGEELIRGGKTAFLTVAGGQGSRLGFDGPKGMFPVTPIRKLTLFAVFAEKLRAARGRFGAEIPGLIMTSPQNEDATREYFEREAYFGLGRDSVRFFIQGTLPSLSPEGELLLGRDGGLFFNPNGHGGTLEALRASGILEETAERGIEELFYFQIDNPLVAVPDPVFLGFHRRAGSRISTKVIRKAFPEEKLGTIGILADGKPVVIEYSDLPPELMYEKALDGSLSFSHGSIAIHLIKATFISAGGLDLPLHTARKKAMTLNPTPEGTEIVEREAVKFEMFVFDAIPRAEQALFFETDRAEEFAPVKNKQGIDSVETCIRGQIEKFAGWLSGCGIRVPRDASGRPLHAVEIGPLYAFDRESLAEKRSGLPSEIDHDILLA
jgi:UDP-N-acetylglucosamine/UDP-N-acetylgalactosamine diphosphorylase